MNNDNEDNRDRYTGVANINDPDKAKLLEVMNDIQMKEETKQRIMAACTGKADAAERHGKNAFRIFGTRIGARQAALPALAAVLVLSIAGYNIFAGISAGQGQPSGGSSSESQDISGNSSGTSQTVNSQDLTPIVVSVPKWFSPGELVANQFYQNFLPGTTFQQTLSSQYIYVNAQKDAIFKTEEHKNCRNFRFNVKTGTIECIDHSIREILIPAGIMQETDRIYFKDCTPSDEFALIDIRSSKDAFKSTYRFNLQTGDFLKIKEDLNHLDGWQIFKDYSTLITIPEYSSEWKIYLTDIVSGTKKNIVSEANATDMFALSPDNRYVWYSIFKNGNKNLRCIYQIATGTKTFITTESYPFFTSDDQFMLYFAKNQIHRMNLVSKEDVVLVEDASWETKGGIDIAAYDDAAGKLILSAFDTALHYDLYSLDVRTGKMVHIVDPDNGVQLAAPTAGSSAQSMSMQEARTSLASGSLSPVLAGFLNFSNQSETALSSIGSYVVSRNYSDSTLNSSGSFQDKSQDIPKPTQSVSEDLLQPAPVVSRGASVYLFDKTGKYIFYYTDLHGKGGSIYCYDIASGDQFAVALPEEFVKKLMAERQNLLYPDKPFPVRYRLYLSDDATHIYLTYEIYRSIDSDPVPLSKLVEYAEKYNTIIHFGKYFDHRYYGNELPGRSYSSYTDDGKIAILNENYNTRKFALILFDKPLDTTKPYGGGEVLIQKDTPADADWFLADWWDHNYNVGTVVYNLDSVLNFVKTHDSLNGFAKIFSRYSIGYNDDSGTRTEFHYQICIGPNDYVNVTENYAEMKLQIIGSKTGAIVFEKALNPAIRNSDRLPK